MLVSGVHVSESMEINCKMSEERHKNDPSVEKLPRRVCESRLFSFVKVEVK